MEGATLRLICLLFLFATVAAAKSSWKPLFDGKSIATDWYKRGEQDYWSVDPTDSSIVGSSGGAVAPKSLLMTVDSTFDQFTVKYSYRLKAGCSGFFFRARENAQLQMEAVQVEAKLEGGKMKEVGSLYVMPTEGWAVQHSDAWSAAAAPDPHAWQKVVLTVKRPHVYVNVNGKQAVGETDAAVLAAGAKPVWDYTKSPSIARPGRFALQIHEGMVMDVKFKDIALLEGCGDINSVNYDGNFVSGLPKQAAVYRDNGTCSGLGASGSQRTQAAGSFLGRVERRGAALSLDVTATGYHAFELRTLDGKLVFSAASPGPRAYTVTRALPRGVYLAVLRSGNAYSRRTVALP